MNQIVFCRHDQPYYEFSNFYISPIIYNGKRWRTTEHLYQAMKFEDENIQEKIRSCASARQAAKLGRSYIQGQLRANWDDIKYGVMKDIILCKVKQHPRIKKLLLDTGDVPIIEYSKKDYVWGSGANFEGKNWLGKIWMEIRSALRSQNNDV